MLQIRKQLEDECDNLRSIQENIEQQYNIEQINLKHLKKQKQEKQDEITTKQDEIHHLQDIKKELENDIKVRELGASAQAHAVYENELIKLQSGYEEERQKIQEKYDTLIQEKDQVQTELNSLKATRAAAIAAAYQEKNVNNNKDFYCLTLSSQDLNDVNILREVVKRISKPRAILTCI